MLGENLQTIRESTEILIKVSKDISLEVGLPVNLKKIKYVIMSCQQNVVRNQNIIIGNLSFENVEKCKNLGER